MIKFFITLFFWISIFNCTSQSIISGIVTDTKGIPIYGANIYLDGTYDGASSSEDGSFEFKTNQIGLQTLVISFLSFEVQTYIAPVDNMNDLQLKLKEDPNALDSVILTAGSFSAGDNSKVSVLKPLDIVTTAGAAGDYMGAFQTLPGTSNVGEDGRLFVRGGTANETNVYIDGLKVFQPFSATTNNLPTRGRFSPFLFKGTNFSTGGYSAEFDNALSSILSLNTIDEPMQEKTEISIINVGVGAGNTQKWKNNSISFNGFYLNLKPYQEIISQRVEWIRPFTSFSGETVYRHQFQNGLLKVYGGITKANLHLIQEDIDIPEGIDFELQNLNTYLNSSYNGDLGKDWSIFAGGSFSLDQNKVQIDQTQVENQENATHLKIRLRKRFDNSVNMIFGAEQFLTDFNEDVKLQDSNTFVSGFKNPSTAIFYETNIFFTSKLAMRLGVRSAFSSNTETINIAPRVSLAYKTGKSSQLSLAYGNFNQTAENDILKYNDKIDQEKSSHYIFNYLYQKNGKMLRAELYHKSYDNLIKYDTPNIEFDSNFNNTGSGYASGIDIFWRDNKSFKNLEYWVSYSYLDTKRNFKNYLTKATPNFASTHNASIVGKYWITNWKSQIGATYNFASGRNYTNPNLEGFLNQKTKNFNSLNLNWAYLISQQKILYFSVSNVLGSDAVFNYQYSSQPNNNGIYNRRAVKPAADRFFIVGFFWTISKNKNDNQLNNL